jgi:hypothetical protein
MVADVFMESRGPRSQTAAKDYAGGTEGKRRQLAYKATPMGKKNAALPFSPWRQ